jgi:DNA-binding PucR family transcriptional regulator
LPAKAAAVVVEPDNEVARKLLGFDGNACLRLWRDDRLIAILPDPDAPGRRDRLASTLRGVGAVLGVPVPIDQLPVSLSIAQLAMRLRRRRVLAGDPLFAEDHLDTLIVHQDDRLLAALRARCLAPLSGLREPARDRLEETLRSWLRNLGDQKAVAAELHIHPQTVRYRLRQLRECYGPALDDRRLRESLVLALAWGRAA